MPMREGLRPGAEASVTISVTDDMVARFEELGLVHPVYSTWSMVRHVELASRKVILPYLEPDEEAVGYSVSVTHLAPARRRGEEYLLERKLVRRKSTGEVINPTWLQFSFPTRWHYDVLRALEYFRSVGNVPDPRMDEAIDVLRSKQQPDGTWLLENTHPGKVHFALEDGDSRPSRWNTVRALRFEDVFVIDNVGTRFPSRLVDCGHR